MANKKNLGTLEVEIKAKIDSFKKSINEAKKAVSDMGKKTSGKSGAEKSLDNIRRKAEQTKKSIASIKGVKGFSMPKAGKYTDEYLSLRDKIKMAEDELGKLYTAEKKLESSKPSSRGAEYDKWSNSMLALEKETLRLGRDLDSLRGKQGVMESMGNATKRVHGPFARLRAQIYNVVNTAPKLRTIGSSMSDARAKFARASSEFKKTAGYIGSLIVKAKNAIPILRKLGNSGKSSGNLVGMGFKKILMYGFGIRSIFKLVNRLRQTMIDGFADIANAIPSSEFASQIQAIKTSFYGLKGAFVSAFAPIFTYVAPALIYLMNLLQAALSAFGQFMSALTGKAYVKATTNIGAVGAAADSAGGSAGKAAKANEELKRSLMGFDQINKLDSDKEDESGSSGGGGGGGGGSASPINYSEGTVSKAVSDFAKKFKEAWRKADFTEIGTIVGNKLKTALDSINWYKIKNTCWRLARSIATFINGFVETEGLGKKVGYTIAQAFNSALTFVYTYVKNLHWRSIGIFIGDTINGFFENFNFSRLGESISGIIAGVLNLISGAIETVNWQQVGKKFGEMIKGINFGEIFIASFRFVGNIAGAIAGLIQGALSSLWGTIKTYFKKRFKECGGNIPAGILEGIKDALVDIPIWIKDNIFVPFLDGIKSAFRIGSPSKEMKPIGEAIIDGLFGGLKATFKKVIEWAGGLADKFKEALGDAKDWISEKTKTVKTKLQHAGGKVAEVLGFKDGGESKKFFDGVTKTIKTKVQNQGQKVYASIGLTKQQFADLMAGKSKTVKVKFKAVGKGIEALAGTKKALTVRIKRKVVDGGGKIEKFLGIVKVLSAKIKRTHASGWTTIEKFLDIASVKSAKIKRVHAPGWTSINQFLGIASVLSARIKAVHASGWNGINSFLGIGTDRTVTINVDFKWNGRKITRAGGKFWTMMDITLSKANGGIFKNGSWKPITSYAMGGSPDGGQIFRARENGNPELVGTIGGSTSVLNNDQIVASVSAGVANAVASVMKPLVKAINSGNSGDLVVFLGDEEVARSSMRGMKKIDKLQHPVIQLGGF